MSSLSRDVAVNFEGARSRSFRGINRIHFVTAAEASADIDDSIKRAESPQIDGAVRNATLLISERLSYIMLQSLVPKTFMHAHASTRMCDLNATIIRK